MSSLTAIFGNSEEKNENSEKLMELYWNRAELKKEFARMRKEQYRLQDRIKEQEGRTARTQQRLDHLEELLRDPEWAHNVVVYYQLRGLGQRAERKLARFAEQLKQQREQKKYDSLMVNWNDERKQEARTLEGEVLETRDRIQTLEDQLQSEQSRLTRMSRFVRTFRGRSVMKLIDSLAAQLEVSVKAEHSLNDRIEEIMNRQPPDHQGLDIPAKRSINLMILSFAQQLYAQLDEAGIASLAKEATEKSVGAIKYGTPFECQQLLERICRGIQTMEKATEFAEILKKRALLLGERAKFPGSDHAVPVPGTVAMLFMIDAGGIVREKQVNIVGENYWGISNVFSR